MFQLLRQCRVLVLEDDHLNSELLRYIFEEHGAVVEQVYDVEGALAALGVRRPDLTIVDYQMSDGSTADAVIAKLEADNTPFVVASGSLRYARLDKLAAVRHMLSKPYLMEELIEAVRVAFECSANSAMDDAAARARSRSPRRSRAPARGETAAS